MISIFIILFYVFNANGNIIFASPQAVTCNTPTLKECKVDWDIQKIIIYKFSNLLENNKLCGISIENKYNIRGTTVYIFRNDTAERLKSEDLIFQNIVNEIGECKNQYLVEINMLDKKIRYFICFILPDNIEIKAVYINSRGKWSRTFNIDR